MITGVGGFFLQIRRFGAQLKIKWILGKNDVFFGDDGAAMFNKALDNFSFVLIGRGNEHQRIGELTVHDGESDKV